MVNIKASEMAADVAIAGTEWLIGTDSDGTTPVTITPTVLKNWIIDQIEAIATAGAIDSGDSFQILQNDNTLKPVTYEIVENAIAETMYDEADIGALADADVFLVQDNATTKGTTTAAALATYMLAELEGTILDITDKAAKAAPADVDHIMINDGTTAKKTTWAELRASVLGGLDTYLAALAAAGAGDPADLIYVTQTGVEKKMTLLQLKTYVGVSITGTGVADRFARWTNATTLKADISLVNDASGFELGLDTEVPTTACVRGEMDEIIGDDTEIGAALADGDHILVRDATDGLQYKSLLSRLYTWLLGQVTAGTVSASEIVVTDASKDLSGYRNHGATNYDAGASGTAGSFDVFPTTAAKGKISYQAEDNAADTTITITNEEQAEGIYVSRLYKYPDVGHRQSTQFKMLSLADRYRLEWIAGVRGIPQLNGSIANDNADRDFEILGTSASNDDVTLYAEGGIQMQTDGADGDEVILLPHLDAGQSAWSGVTWGTDQEVRWECRIKTGANVLTNCIIWAGLKLTNTEVVADDDDQIFFRYEDGVNAGKFQIIRSVGDTDVEADTTVTVAANTDYHLVIVIQADRTVEAWINGLSTFPTGATAMTNATDLIPYIGIATDGGGAGVRTLYVRGQAIERDFA